MLSKGLTVALALASAASAAPALMRRDDCQAAYKVCVAAGTYEIACSCTLAACLGEDNARNREYCASATASLEKPTNTGIPGGCNPAHPGSCPSSYFTYTTELPTRTFTVTPIYPVPTTTHPAKSTSKAAVPSSSDEPKSKATSTSCETTTTTKKATTTSCETTTTKKAATTSCETTFKVVTTTSARVSSPAVPSPSAAPVPPADSTFPDPKPVEGKTWVIKDLTRYCGEGNEGCDYNFKIQADGKTERCTVIRMPGADAATESWSNQQCTDGSDFKVSWGYVTEPAPAFAVITVVKGKELAWFGVSDVNGQKVTPSSPFGSGDFGNLGPEQVYTY